MTVERVMQVLQQRLLGERQLDVISSAGTRSPQGVLVFCTRIPLNTA